MGVLHQLHAVKGAVAVFALLHFSAFVWRILGAQVVVGGNQEATGARGGILDHIVQRGLHHGNDAVDQIAGAKYWPAPLFFSLALRSSRPSYRSPRSSRCTLYQSSLSISTTSLDKVAGLVMKVLALA